MSRTKRKRSARRRALPAGKDAAAGASLETRLSSALDAGRYKDAIAACKALLKAQPDGPWRTQLARAYAGRARELVAKGMFTEALAIWEQRATSCATARVTPDYLLWMLLAGRAEQAIALMREHADALEATGSLGALREHLAAFALAHDEGIVASLAVDDPVARDHAFARELLHAFCEADEPAFESARKRIPFRSPYRGLRQLLDAWRQWRHDPDGAVAALGRIDAHSPFRDLADALARVASTTATSRTDPSQLLRLDARGLELIGVAERWPPERSRLLTEAQALGPSPDAKALFALVMAHVDAFGEHPARAAALALLPDHPRGRSVFAKRFGEPSRIERLRFEAIRAERDRDPLGIDHAWRAVLDALEPDTRSSLAGNGRGTGGNADGEPGGSDGASSGTGDADDGLRAALIHRRLADLWSHVPERLGGEELVLEDLAAAQELDPEDRSGTVRLIAAARDAGELKQARAALAEALERFPDDAAVLLEAVRTALAGNAFKKAAGLAARLLAIDPINVPVQGMLLDAHLAHARKQIRSGRRDLARRQLDEAGSWARGAAAAGRVDILRALLEMDGRGDADGTALLRRGFAALGGALVGLFHVLLESARLERHGASVLKRAGLPDAREFREPGHVLELMRALAPLPAEERRLVARALEPLDKALRAAAKRPFALDDDELVCETLLRLEQLPLLTVFAGQAARRWPDRPAFVYLQIFAETQGHVFRMDGRQDRRLMKALERAQQNGDMRTVHRIDQFMRPPLSSGSFFDPFPDDSPFDPFDDPLDEPPPELAALIEMFGPEVLVEIAEAAAHGENPDDLISRLFERAAEEEPGNKASGGKRGKGGTRRRKGRHR